MKLRKIPIKPRRGRLSSLVHVLLTIALPVLMYIFIRLDFAYIAVLLLLLSKWRMFAVKSRHWIANIRSNAIDIFVGLAAIVNMMETDSGAVQVAWVLLYAGWLLFLKPKSTTFWVSLQAIVGQALAISALYSVAPGASTAVLVVATWGIGYVAARHFFTAYDEPMSRPIAYSWAFFNASIGWLSAHWLLFYGPIAQPALLISILGYGLASMYYLSHKDRLTYAMRWQFISVMTLAVVFLIIFSDWTTKIV